MRSFSPPVAELTIVSIVYDTVALPSQDFLQTSRSPRVYSDPAMHLFFG